MLSLDEQLQRFLGRVAIIAAIVQVLAVTALVDRHLPHIEVNAEFLPKLQGLFQPYRFKVLHGGRGGVKSWSAAQALLIQGADRPLRIPCARETMQSIKDSVHELLENQIERLKLGGHYRVRKSFIEGANGTLFTFHGLRQLTVHNIKSLEGADILWAEEAQNISKKSWETVIPTIRKPGSQIWVTFNPEFADHPVYDTYKRFVVRRPPNSWVQQTNWRDNKWISQEMLNDLEYLKQEDPEEYEHIWEGKPRSSVKGAIYATELSKADTDGRITKVPYDASRPVDTFWDLGFGDMVSIWFAQSVGMQYRVLDYYQNTHQSIDFYLKVLQQKEYTYGTAVLPWDGGAPQLGTGRSIEELVRAKGFKARVLPRWSVSQGIAAVRAVFSQLWFDAERCTVGVEALRRYQYGEPSKNGVAPREPLHDDASHPADALRALAVAIKAPEEKKKKPAVGPRPKLSIWS
jgi:phage terminase large subunit